MRVPKDVIQYAIDHLNENKSYLEGTYRDDLHNEIFNTDYFIIGNLEAEKWLTKNIGIFKAIEIIQNYEKDNFGESFTDVGCPEKVCNVYVYIAGEELLNRTSLYKFSERLTKEELNELIEELEEM